MGNLKTLRGLLACIAFLESMSTNSVNTQCQDRHECARYPFPLVCEGKQKEWYLKYCPKSCKACPADQLSKMYVDTSTFTLTSSKSTTREERNVNDVNNVSSLLRLTTVSMRVASVTVSSGACKDDNECTRYKNVHRRCSVGWWFRKHCRLSCNMCITDQVSVTRDISHTITTSPITTNQVSVQEHDDVSLASSHTRHMTASKRVASVTAVSGECKDEKVCTGFKDLHRRCPGTDGWYREHCRLSCNTCITDQVSVTRDISHTSTISPVRSTNVSVQVHSDVTLAPSHPQRTVVTTWIPSSAAPSHPQRTLVTTWIPSSAGDGQNMEWVMNNIAVTVLTPILVILVIVIIVITRIKGRKVVLTPQREQSKVVVTYSGVTPQPEKQAYTAIDLEAHTYSSVDDIRHETEDYQNINDRGSQHIGMNQDQCTSDSRTVDCTLYENAGKKMGTEDTDNYIHICENKSKSILK